MEKDTKQFFDRRRELDLWKHRLPHWQQQTAFIFVTWRLADSLPAGKLQQWEEEERLWLRLHPRPWDKRTEREYHKYFSWRLEHWLDHGSGSCLLRDPANARIVRDSLLFRDGQRYHIEAFVVMPNHVHVLFQPEGGHSLASIVRAWKGFTGRTINARTGSGGALWQDSYWDRLIRDQAHFAKCRDYIRRNPEKARLSPGAYSLYVRGE